MTRFLVAALFSLSATAAAQLSPDAIEALRAEHDVPALAACAFDAEGVRTPAVAGVLTINVDAPADETSRFHLGSLTKAMTATLAARLVEQGLINWDTTLEQTMPEIAAKIPESHRGVTLEQLLAHRAGLPDDRQAFALMAKLYQLKGELPAARREAIVIAFTQDVSPVGEQMVYANAGYYTAGAMLESVAGKPWEVLMQEQVFAPLGIESAGFGPPFDSDGRLTQPMGHMDQILGRVAMAPGPHADNPPLFGPAGTVHMTIGDLALFARDQLLGHEGKGNLLTRQSYRKLHSDPEHDGYALGWAVRQSDDGEVSFLGHAGSNGRWFAVISIDLGGQRGAVAATNIANDQAGTVCDKAIRASIQTLD